MDVLNQIENILVEELTQSINSEIIYNIYPVESYSTYIALENFNSFTKRKKYRAEHKLGKVGIYNDNNILIKFKEEEIDKYFIDLKESRKNKLKNLDK